ncbi:CoA pyrophosphatase [Neolewinella aurantiaca]|uniref:CoA pyrophosphatase n=1 Tax=Neolewinella aurantiaca TaxID=2602767 RepID=A0A5C7FRJ4_9BACT|nr:CoA pyrophosphatase [Neolewinella aurantiaca]TXF90592.1 CoA pyrophosphatase [Neolewinella aurantiaca]
MNEPVLTSQDQQLLDLMRERLVSSPLPGLAAQRLMAPPVRGEYSSTPLNARRASVMVLFYPIAERLHLLYIQRTSPKRDRHAGQISFPGGSADPEDKDAAHTALRELEEEVGVPPHAVELIGELSPLYIPVSNFLVLPFVGWVDERPDFIPQESEVARILELPFADFFTPHARKSGPRKIAGGMTLPDTPFWSVREEQIWGATAMMTGELVALLTD